ncbi:MBG domain-containing protein [uncultured Polaribacter sp.]|uniref:MBG domain-containing protein n=1 Tax=uncultured Polaribacter sp. TaxID=174711 RepID=UPI00260A2265|nr:MBG domain-containing protein [uncultured Polaribacter sp.]
MSFSSVLGQSNLDFSYSGTYSEVTLQPGTYELEVWGAQGGGGIYHYGPGGKGGYSKGVLDLTVSETLYIYVGQKGFQSGTTNTAFNGGGAGSRDGGTNIIFHGFTGGGATHIAKKMGVLSTLNSFQSDVLIVAGGGGGGGGNYSYLGSGYDPAGGAGGGIAGLAGAVSTASSYRGSGNGGTQTAGGATGVQSNSTPSVAATFGLGASADRNTADTAQGGGGGGGWYGGGAGSFAGGAGGGGSGYIGGVTSGTMSTGTRNGDGYARITQIYPGGEIEVSGFQHISSSTLPTFGSSPYEYQWQISTDGSTFTDISGETSDELNPANISQTTYYRRKTIDNTGVFKYTNVVKILKIAGQSAIEYNYTGSEKSITLPPGTYELEAWGAQGGGDTGLLNKIGVGGKGGYSKGEIVFTEATTIYLSVGQEGFQSHTTSTAFNGGGSGNPVATSQNDRNGFTGGGATHMALENGLLSALSNSKDKVLIVAGAGGAGGGAWSTSYNTAGGYGGGIVGATAPNTPEPALRGVGRGGSQTSGGVSGYDTRTTYSGNEVAYIEAGFGRGASSSRHIGDIVQGGGGGGGWYGGGAGSQAGGGGGGGSGYVKTNLSSPVLTAGNASMPNPSGGSNIIGNTGNGFARITELRGNVTIVASGGADINNGWTYSNGLIKVGSNVSINASVIENYLSSGDLTIDARSITVNSPISYTGITERSLTFKSLNYIDVNASVKATGSGELNIILWSDQSAIGGVDIGGYIDLALGVELISNGGTLVLAGGEDNGANGGTASDGIPDGYAWNSKTTSHGGILLGPADGTTGSSVNLLSDGGDIIIRGKTSGSIEYPGILSAQKFIINSGSGTILMDGDASLAHGIELAYGSNANYAITSNSTESPAISITGSTQRSGYTGAIFSLREGAYLIESRAISGGGIQIKGGNTNSSGNEIYFNGDASNNAYILSKNGPIEILSSSNSTGGVVFTGNTYFGGASASTVNGFSSSVTSSSSSISLDSDYFTFNGQTAVTTSGAFSMKPTSDSFGEAQTISNLLFSGNESTLNIGKPENTATVNLSSDIEINGPISIYAGTISLNANISSTLSGADILTKATGDISLATNKSITTNGGDIILWANSDGQTSNGSVLLRDDSLINTAGGSVWIGGGSGNTTWNDLTVGNGYAVSGTSFTPSDGGGDANAGVYFENATIQTNGGNILVKGDGGTNYASGITTYGGNTINSGNGTIEWDGKTSSSFETQGISFGLHDVIIAGNTSFNSTSTGVAVKLKGSSNARNGIGVDGIVTIESSGSGSIDLTGTGASPHYGIEVGNYYNGSKLNLYAASGEIKVDGGSMGISVVQTGNQGNALGDSKLTIGQGGTISSSTSNIKLVGDAFSVTTNNGLNINASGQLSVLSQGNSFSGPLSWPLTNSTVSNITGLNIGKETNTSNITIGSDQTVAGPISIYGRDIALSANLTSTLSGADILTKASGNIVLLDNKSIETNLGNVILWSDSDTNNEGSIVLSNNVEINTVNGSTASNLNTGGKIVLAGGLDDGSNGGAASDGIPDGFASSSFGNGIKLGTTEANETQMYSGGGDIVIRGFSNHSSTNDHRNEVGIWHTGSWVANSGNGSIHIIGKGDNLYGVNFVRSFAVNNVLDGPKFLSFISNKASGPAITISGTSNTSHGVVFNYNNPKEILATGGGNISITGSGAGSGYGIFLQNPDILSSGGSIKLDGGTKGIYVADAGSHLGAKTGSSITNSTSNITLIADVLNFIGASNILTSGTLTVEPSSNSFSGPLSWPLTNSTVSNITGLNIGKETNTSNITISSDQTIAGPISIYGGNIEIDANITSTNGNILIDGDTGSILDLGADGIRIDNESTIKTITAGDITLLGRSSEGNISSLIGVELGDNSSIQSAGNISITGISESSSDTSARGVFLAGSISASGNINITGESKSSNYDYDVYLTNTTARSSTDSSIITTDGNITIEALNEGRVSFGGNEEDYFITSTSGNIELKADKQNVYSSIKVNVTTSGSLSILARPNDGSEASFVESIDFTKYLFGSNISSLTIGDPTNSEDVIIGKDISISGPINIYGGDINVNANLDTQGGGANGGILLKASGDIVVLGNKSIKTNLGNVILWSDSDGNDIGGVLFNSGSQISTNNGHVWIGGGSGSTSWNGLNVGDSYAANLTTPPTGLSETYAGINAIGSYINAGSGDLFMSGRSFQTNYRYGIGTRINGMDLTANDISIYGVGSSNNNSSSDTNRGNWGVGIENISITTVSNGNILINGVGGGANSGTNGGVNHGVYMNSNSSLLANGSGDIAISGTGGGNSSITQNTNNDGIHLNGADISNDSGEISLTASKGVNNNSEAIYITNMSLGTIDNITISSGTIDLLNEDTLTLGSINATDKITIETLTGDINLTDNISTTSTSTDAIILNAGKSSTPGTTTGGDIKLINTPTLTTGTNGIIKLFSGSETQSTGLAAIADINYFGLDETSSLPTFTAGSTNAIFREVGNNALYTDGSDDYVELSSSPILDGATEFTIELWIKPDGTNFDDTEYHGFLGYEGSSILTRNPSLWLKEGKIHLDSYRDGDLQRFDFLTDRALITQDAWTHIAFVKDAEIYRVYLDGELAITTAAPDKVNISTNAYFLGRINNYFSGQIDEVRFWSDVRTKAEIDALMNIEATGSEPGLVAYYDFNHGAPSNTNTGITTLVDRTNNSNNGTLNNFLLTGNSSNWVNGFFPKIIGERYVYLGKTRQLSHFVSGGTWSIDNNSLANISSTGVLTGVSDGQVAVTYTVNGNSTTDTFDIVDQNNLGTLTIVASGGVTEDNGWAYSNGVIRPTSTSAVNINASSVLEKLNLNHLTIEASSISVNANVSSTYVNNLTLKASANITQASSVDITTNGGDVILWSNSDNETTNGGYIYIQDNATIDTRTQVDRVANNGSNDDENGGSIILAGGDGTSIPSGYALNNTLNSTPRGAISLGTTVVGRKNSGISFISGGGDISLKGQHTSTSGGDSAGISAFEGFTLDAGKTGNITLVGDVSGSSAIYSDGMNLGNFATTAGGTASYIKTVNGNITLTGTSGSGSTQSRGVLLAGGGAGIFVQSTGTGDINITGTSGGGAGTPYNTLFIGANILANSGDINLLSGSAGGTIYSSSFASTIGYKSSSDITTSSTDITLTADKFDLTSGIAFNTSGTFTIKPTSGNSFESTFDTSNLTYSSDVSGLTIGHSSNTGNITVGSATEIAGPISIYGGDITVSANISSTLSGADVLLKASEDISLAINKSISTNAGNLLLWSNSDGSTDNGSILLRDGSFVNTNGGHLWMGGGSGSTTWNGETVGNGFAVSGTTIDPSTGSDTKAGVYLENFEANTSGGDISIFSKTYDTYAFVTHQDVILDSGSGKISLEGIAEIGGVRGGVTGIHDDSAVFTLSSSNSSTSAIEIVFNSESGSSHGATLQGENNFIATNGGISFTSLGDTDSSDYGLRLGYSTSDKGILNFLSSTGTITIDLGANGYKLESNSNSSIHFGAKSGTDITSSSSNVVFNSDRFTIGSNPSTNALNFNTTGEILIAPSSSSFREELELDDQWNLSSYATSLTIGKDTNTSNISIGSAMTIAGPVTLYGGTVAVNAPLTATNSTISITSSTSIIDGASGYLIADGLALNGAGTVTLDHTSNDINTIAAGSSSSPIGALSYTDADDLTIGSVNPTGIHSSGEIELSTLSGDLEVTEPIVSTQATGDAIQLYADKDATSGNEGDGNITITNNGLITVESGARALLYSGKETESTGVQAAVGGESNTRTQVDANTDLSTLDPVIGNTGKYALMRVASTNDNANLSSLTTSAGTLSPVFNSETTEYSVVLIAGTSSVNFTPFTDDTSATLKINNVAHTSGTAYTASNLMDYQLYTIEVTASDGIAKKTYKLAVRVTQVTVPSPTGVWRNLFAGENFDPNDDQQATADTDLVGNATDAMMQAQQGTYSFSDGTIDKVYYFRVRLGNKNAPKTSFYYGMDVDADYKIDFVIEANLKDQTPYVAYHAHDPSKDGSGPSVTAWENDRNDTNIERELGARDARILSYATVGESSTNVDVDGPVGGQNNGDDTWLEFAFTESSFKSWTTDYWGTELTGGDVSGLVAFTSTSQTANGDIGGINDKTADMSLTWRELGNFIESNLDEVTSYTLFIPTVVSQTSNTQTPTVTGTWGGSNEGDDTLVVTIGGVTYTVGNGLTINGSSWSVVVTTSLTEGTYAISATATRTSDGSTKTDSTTDELEIKLTTPLTSTDITTGTIADLVYTGQAQTPTLEVKDGTTVLTQDNDYTLSYSDNINVGTAIVTITGTGNYSGTKQVTFDITTKSLTITGLTGDDKVYDNTASSTASGTASLLGVEENDDVSLGGSPDFTFTSSNVGTGITINTTGYTISGADSGNYTLTQPTLSADITAKELTITGLTGDDKVYDNTTSATASGTASLLGVEENDDISLSGTPDFTFASSNVGTGITINTTGYTISGADAGNYTLTQPTLSADITAKVLTITADDKSKGFGEADPTLTVSYTGFVNGEDQDDLSGTLLISRATGEAANTYAITASGLTATNYAITYVAGTFTIASKSITSTAITTATIADLVYTGQAQTPTLAVKDGTTVLTQATDYTLSYSDNINVGTATVTITGTGDYSGTKTVTFTITKASLTITADDKSKGFGEADPTLTASYTGFVNGEDQDDLSGTLLISRATGEAANTYAITASGLTATNYAITYVAGTFTIASKSITSVDITTATIADLVYTGQAQTPTLAVKDGTTVLTQATDYTLSYSDNINVGTATVTITGTGDYSGTKAVTFTITKASLTITADDKSKGFGESDPTLTASYAGFVSGEDQDDLSGTLLISRATGEAANIYAITASGLTATNYAITYVAGTFTIASKSITSADITTATIADLVYTGQAQTPTLAVKDGTTVLTQATDYTLSYVDNINVGTATVTITGTGDYSGTKTIIFTILKKTLTISGLTADDKEYDGTTEATLSGTATLVGLAVGDDVVLSGIAEGTFTSPDVSTDITVNVVGYEITGTAKDNYSLRQPTGLSAGITQRTISVAPSTGLTKQYGEADPEFTYIFSGSISGQTAAFSGSLSRDQGEAVDQYEITQGSLVLANNGSFNSSNYAIELTANIDFEITKAPLLITVNNDAKFVTQADAEGYAGVSYTGFKFGEDSSVLVTDNLRITRSNAGVESAGIYQDVLQASGLSSSNYEIRYESGNYQIVAADQLYVKLSDSEIVYGETPTYRVELSGYYSSGNTQVVDLTSSTSVTGNKITVVDGASGSATFLIVPETPLYSTSNHLSVGTYNLVSDQAVFTSSNFNNTLIEQGVLKVNPKELVVSLSSSKSKIYDGNALLPSMTFDLSTPFVTDNVLASGTGVYSSANVGDRAYTVSGLMLSGSDANNYYIQGGANVQITGTNGQISKQTLTVTPRIGQSKIFGTSDPILTYDYRGQISGETPLFSGSLGRLSGESRGSYAIRQGSLLLEDKDAFLASNYQLDFTSGIAFTITNKLLSDQDISILPISDLIYNGQSQAPNTALKDVDTVLVEGEDYEVSYINNTDVGKATITLTGLGNYGGVRTVTFNIIPRVLTVTPDANQTKIYGDADPSLTYTFRGLVSGETPGFTNTISRAVGEHVGTYQINQGSLLLIDNAGFKADNYQIDLATGVDFTITKAALTITVHNDSKFVTQQDADGYAGVNYSGFKFGEDQTVLNTTNLIITRSNASEEAVGVYTAVLAASGVSAQNYDITYQKGDYTIIGADQLVVKLKDSEVVYGATPVFEIAKVGYYNLNNQLIEDLTSSTQINGTEVTVTDGTSGTGVFDISVVSPQLSTSGSLQSGSYLLEAGNISKTSPNFSNTIILQGNLNIIPKALIASVNSSKTKVYDGNDKLLNLTLTLNTPITGDVVLASAAGAYDSKDAGTRNYTVSGITLSGSDADNYFIQGGANAAITGTDGEITPRTLIVTPDADQTKIFGELDPRFTYTNSGAVNGETPGFSGTLSREIGEDVGSYQITQGSLVTQNNGVFLTNNYEPSFTEGVDFTITSKLITDAAITTTSIADLVYTGQAQTQTLAVKDGTTVLTQATDYALSYVDNINVGTATVTITGIGNYNGVKTVTFTITKASLTITADDKSKEFGAADPTLTASYAGFVNGEDQEDLSGTLSISRATGEAAGTYAISASGLNSSNYAITFTAGRFTITSKLITDTAITVATISDLIYNGSLQRPKLVVEDGSNTLKEGRDYTLSYSNNINVGTATVTLSGIGNYAADREINFTIVPKSINILIADQEKDYGAQDPILVFTADPNLFGPDAFTGTLTRESGEAVGTYLITSGTLSAGDNYTLDIQTDAIFSIIRIDSDGDGVADDIEEADGTDATDSCDFVISSQTETPSEAWNNADCDNDGVTNAEEVIDGTNSLKADSDGDGVIDGTEKADGTDATSFCSSIPSNITLSVSQDYLAADCDDDGLSNGDEIGLDASNPIDSDNDGVFDYLEVNKYEASIEDDLEVYNLLTPNGDGENDVFVIRNIELYPENTIEIFNRWGVQVYSVAGYGQNGNYFEGVSNGRGTVSSSESLPTGTYFYILKYKKNGDMKERKGYIYLTK